MSEKHLITAVADRLRSPHAVRFALELRELLGRYPAEYVFLNDARSYSVALPFPSEYEQLYYSDYSHTLTAEEVADYKLRSAAVSIVSLKQYPL